MGAIIFIIVVLVMAGVLLQLIQELAPNPPLQKWLRVLVLLLVLGIILSWFAYDMRIVQPRWK